MIARLQTILRRGRAVDDGGDARIRREGYPGRGTVIAVRATGRSAGERTEVALTLDVFIPRRRHFRVDLRPWVSEVELARLEPGRAVPIAADQAQPGRVVLAFDMDEVRSIAGLGPVAGGPGGPLSRPSRRGPEDDR